MACGQAASGRPRWKGATAQPLQAGQSAGAEVCAQRCGLRKKSSFDYGFGFAVVTCCCALDQIYTSHKDIYIILCIILFTTWRRRIKKLRPEEVDGPQLRESALHDCRPAVFMDTVAAVQQPAEKNCFEISDTIQNASVHQSCQAAQAVSHDPGCPARQDSWRMQGVVPSCQQLNH